MSNGLFEKNERHSKWNRFLETISFDILDKIVHHDVKLTSISDIIQIRSLDIMKTINVRGIDSILSNKLKQAAKEESRSVNQVVIDIMKQRFGIKKEKNIP